MSGQAPQGGPGPPVCERRKLADEANHHGRARDSRIAAARGLHVTGYHATATTGAAASRARVAGRAALAQRLTAIGSPLPPAIIARSFAQLTLTSDPLTATLLTEAQHAAAAGLIKPITNLTSIYDLGPLNQVLKAAGV